MFHRLLFTVPILLLFCSCEWHEWVDSHKIEKDIIYCFSEGEKYEIDIRRFSLCEGDFCYADSITLDDEVKTANTGFEIRRDQQTDIRYAGNYEIRRFRYKAAFIVYISAWVHETYLHYLPFEFEAEEIWLNGQAVVEQPFVFEKQQTILTQEPPTPDETDVFAKYLLKFPMTVYYRYNGQVIDEFFYNYHVVRKNTSVWDGVPPSDISIEVTFDYKP